MTAKNIKKNSKGDSSMFGTTVCKRHLY